jgi:RNA polymerase sigma-70 factor (ECF subfamily)
MGDPSDADLLRRFRAGDDRALDDLFERHEASLYCFLLGILHDTHQAKDALQETFVRALERLDGVDPDHLRGWLFTVAYHQAMLSKRQGASRRRVVGAGGAPMEAACDPGAGPLDRAAQRDDARRLRDLLERLPPQQQEVIRQRVYEGKKFREIAQALNCPLNTALARMHEGLRRLRLLWGESHA